MFLDFDWIRSINRFKSVESEPDLDWGNGKIARFYLKLYFVNFTNFSWT